MGVDKVKIEFKEVNGILLITPAIAIVNSDDDDYTYYSVQCAFIRWNLSFTFCVVK